MRPTGRRPWPATGARNLARSSRRYAELLARLPEPEAVAQPGEGAGAALPAIRNLPGPEREVVALCLVAGFAEREAAAALGIPPGTVKSRLSRRGGDCRRRCAQKDCERRPDMSDTTEQETARDAALARTLSAMAETPPARRRLRWRGIVAILGVFALAGAGTGALTAGALARTAWTPDDTLLKSEMADFAAGGIGYSKPAGVPAFQHRPGTVDLRLGDGPASSIAAVAVWCLGAGSATWRLGEGTGAPTGTLRCEAARQTPKIRNLAVGAWTNAHLSGTLTGDVAIWAGQLTVAAEAGPSGAQQNAVADKVVTRDEYLQAWARMAGCMDSDGYDYSPNEPDQILLSTGVDGAHAQRFDLECYPREFQDVDTLWQSQMDLAVAACLTAHGVAGTNDDLDTQLQQAGLTPESCHLW